MLFRSVDNASNRGDRHQIIEREIGPQEHDHHGQRGDGRGEYGNILRAKGYVDSNEGEWLYFDLVPGEYQIRTGQADFTGRICVIGENLNADKLSVLFDEVN